MKIYNFTVFISQDADGVYMAQVPQLQGCHTQADSLDVLYERAKEAIELYLEVQKEKRSFVLEDKFIGVQQVEVHA